MCNLLKVTLLGFAGLFLLLSLSMKASMYTDMGAPKIKAGKSKIIGKVISPNEEHRNNSFVSIYVPQPISGEALQYEADIDELGRFDIEVDMETDISLVSIRTSFKPFSDLFVVVKSGGVMNIDITFNPDLDIEDVRTEPEINRFDMMRSWEVMREMFDYRGGVPTSLHNKDPVEFLNHAKASVSKRLEILDKDSLISKDLKEVLAKDFRALMYSGHVFDYDRAMILNFRNTVKDSTLRPAIRKIDRSYFAFLKDFDLNNPQYLIGSSFSEFQKQILKNEIIGLPEIGESDIPSWLANAKAILSDLVGFKDGQYYDILAANAYGEQLNEEIRPLTEKQKRNIADYWRQGEIAKILFRKNQKVVELDKFKSSTAVGDVSAVPDDEVMETIVAKYKGKVVLVDFWATWCAPCLDAMTQFRSTKTRFKDKGVAFVYITNGSSPRKQWEQKINGIGSEHYYLSSSQWEYLMKLFEFQYIPSYVLFNKEGVLIEKFSGFPGSNEVKKMIERGL